MISTSSSTLKDSRWLGPMVLSALICFVEAAVWWNDRWNSDALRAEPSRLLQLRILIPYLLVILFVLRRRARNLGLSLATGAGLAAIAFCLSLSIKKAFFHSDELFNFRFNPSGWVLVNLFEFGVRGVTFLPQGFMAWCAVKAWRDLEAGPRRLAEFLSLSCLGLVFTLVCGWDVLDTTWW
jgi:hypothetical protein